VPVRDIILMAYFVISVPVCFVRPFYGIALWTIVAFLNPHAFTWQRYTFRFPWAESVAIPTLLGFLFFSRGGWRRLMNAECVLMSLLWMWFTITSFISTSTPIFMHHADLTWFRWQFVSKILAMTLVTVAIVDSFDRLRKLTLIIAASFGFFVVKALPFVISTGGGMRVYGPEASMIADNNAFGLALNMTLPLFFCLAQVEEKPWLRRLLWALFVITIPATFFTYSRGALVGMVAIMGLLLLRSRSRLVLAPVIVLALAMALLFAPEGWKDRMDPTKENAIDGSAQARLNAWQFSWNLASDYPIAGGGFGTYTRELFAIYSPKVTRNIHGPHSIYFQMIGEHGFVGFTLYVLLLFQCFLGARRLDKEARSRGDDIVSQYTRMFRFSLVAFLTSGAFLGLAYFDYFFTVVACMAILKNVVRREWADADAEAESEAEAEESDPAAALAWGDGERSLCTS
jgi:probable O-glycosylation ligase (exosortase A-associated)